MLSKLRTDIREKLKNTKHILVDGKMLNGSVSGYDSGNNIADILAGLMKKLGDLGVCMIIFSDEKTDLFQKSTCIEVYPCNTYGLSDHIKSNGKNIDLRDCILVVSSEPDKKLMESSAFSFAPSSAPLDVKMISSYVSHEDGIKALFELSDLVNSAKTFPYGFDK